MKDKFSKIGIILAGLGSAVGLGNIWRFPYIASKYGIEFFIIYLFVSITLSIPLLISELSLGRKIKGNILKPLKQSMPFLGSLTGLIVTISSLLLSTYYAPLTATVLGYAISDPSHYPQFNNFFGSTENISLFIIISVITLYILSISIKKGIEKIAKIMMPLLFILVIFLLIYVIFILNQTSWIFLKINISNFLNQKMWLDAISQSIFSLSAGMGIMIVYGSHTKKNQSIKNIALFLFIGDTLIAFSGYAIVNGILNYSNIEVVSGIDLAFKALTDVVYVVPFGGLVSFGFFALLFIAAFTSLVSILEVPYSYLKDRGIKNVHVYIGVFLLVIGFIVIKKSLVKEVDFLVGKMLLPLCAALVSIVTAQSRAFEGELKEFKELVYIILTYILPIFIGFLLLFY